MVGSVFPSNRSHGGFPSFNTQGPALIKYNDITIKELPINYHTFLSKPIIYSGGGYFRLIPYYLIYISPAIGNRTSSIINGARQ